MADEGERLHSVEEIVLRAYKRAASSGRRQWYSCRARAAAAPRWRMPGCLPAYRSMLWCSQRLPAPLSPSALGRHAPSFRIYAICLCAKKQTAMVMSLRTRGTLVCPHSPPCLTINGGERLRAMLRSNGNSMFSSL